MLGCLYNLIATLTLPLVKGEGTRWPWRKYVGWSLLAIVNGVVFGRITDDSDEFYCALAPEVLACYVVDSSVENPSALSATKSWSDFEAFVQQSPTKVDILDVVASMSETQCVDEMSLEQALVVLLREPTGEGLLYNNYDASFDGIKTFLSQTRSAIPLAVSISSNDGTLEFNCGTESSFVLPASIQTLSETLFGAGGQFFNMTNVNGKTLVFPALFELQEDGRLGVTYAGVTPGMDLILDGVVHSEWAMHDSAFIAASQQQLAYESELAKAEAKAEAQRLAEIERSMPKLTASQLYSSFESNELRAEQLYEDKIIQVSGIVDEVENSSLVGVVIRLRAGYWETVTCFLEGSEANFAKAMKLGAGSKVTLRGKCQDGDSVMDCVIK